MEVSSRRRTRSQAAPDWKVNDSLILVNEMAAIEVDCSKALSSYQKWKIIADNCTALGVLRDLNQCRRKWDSLLSEFNKIKLFDLYWTSDKQKRKQHGLPEDFDHELFKAIDAYLRLKEDEADTEPDSDPEAEADMLKSIAELGCKRQKRRLMHAKNYAEEVPPTSCAQALPQISCTQGETHRESIEETPQKSCTEEKERNINIVGEREQMMVEELRENAQLINDIVKGNIAGSVVYEAANMNATSAEDFHADFVKRQGDRLIACLGDVVDTLNRLFDM
ncbi:uncharacterized protein LOC120004854 isoform X2 [Tripterygium wilfordii]|uniref:uncharacterized protein LOC120004854 isoform X2 n=1 Tax=Tripterygium wilfordii TaxID=458696 RepID=UPI0018F85EB5|nr:uncharacterized protein LOC120004854 isoform X2 [Tripterygium wilfordii]